MTSSMTWAGSRLLWVLKALLETALTGEFSVWYRAVSGRLGVFEGFKDNLDLTVIGGNQLGQLVFKGKDESEVCQFGQLQAFSC